jgi:hypothetical protein
MLVAAAVLISSAALAQTKDQCGTVASVLAPVISYIVPLEERVTSINWDLVIPNSSGRFKSSAEVVKQAQINFITATRRTASLLRKWRTRHYFALNSLVVRYDPLHNTDTDGTDE